MWSQRHTALGMSTEASCLQGADNMREYRLRGSRNGAKNMITPEQINKLAVFIYLDVTCIWISFVCESAFCLLGLSLMHDFLMPLHRTWTWIQTPMRSKATVMWAKRSWRRCWRRPSAKNWRSRPGSVSLQRPSSSRGGTTCRTSNSSWITTKSTACNSIQDPAPLPAFQALWFMQNWHENTVGWAAGELKINLHSRCEVSTSYFGEGVELQHCNAK